jgi:addiction module RelB/DinJ family antitoxin
MNTKTTILIKVDKKAKAAAQKAAKEIGIPLSTVLGMYLRKFASEQRIEFSVPEMPNAKTRKIINEARRELAAGKAYGPFVSVDDMFAELDK